MKDEHQEILTLFVNRPLLFISQIEQEQVVAFITGFEFGAKGKGYITGPVGELLADEYRLYGSNQGWPRQVLLYAEKKGLSWFEAFKEVLLIILSKDAAS